MFCRPENPRRRNSIELEEIKESLRNNGCWPFHHGSVLLDKESDEEDNSAIVRGELGIPGPSNQRRTRPTPKEATEAIIGLWGKGRKVMLLLYWVFPFCP